MQDIPLVVYNANRSGTKLSRFTHKSLHHRPMRKQEVIHRIWIQLCKMVVDLVGIFYFRNVFWRGKHTFSRQNSRHLLQRECVLLDGQRRINRSDSILAAQNRACGKILGGTDFAYQFADLHNIRKRCFCDFKWRFLVSHDVYLPYHFFYHIISSIIHQSKF